MKHNFKTRYVYLFALPVLLASCRHKADDNSADRFTDNKSEFIVDESFRPIVDEELYIFKNAYNKVDPKIVYAPENTAVNMLLADSARVVILSRDLNAQERDYLLKTRNLKPVIDRFAIDAISLIVNQA